MNSVTPLQTNEGNKMENGISKTTKNFAEKREVSAYLGNWDGLSIDIYASDYENTECSDLQYRMDEDSGDFQLAYVWNKNLTDLPNRISNDKELRVVIDMVAKSIKTCGPYAF